MRKLEVMMTSHQEGTLHLFTVTEETTVPEICDFAMNYAKGSYSTSQRVAQIIVRSFAQVKDGTRSMCIG